MQTPVAITINAQYVRDLSFENPHAPHSLMPGNAAPTAEVQAQVQARPLGTADAGLFEVALTLRAQAQSSERPLYVAEVTYGAAVSLPPLPEPVRQAALMVEAPRLIFPFARQILADMIRDGGFAPLLVNPIDFVALYQQSRQPASGTA